MLRPFMVTCLYWEGRNMKVGLYWTCGGRGRLYGEGPFISSHHGLIILEMKNIVFPCVYGIGRHNMFEKLLNM
jgi:hypothetical protein